MQARRAPSRPSPAANDAIACHGRHGLYSSRVTLPRRRAPGPYPAAALKAGGMSMRGSGDGIRCPDALAHPVRVHDCLPHHLSGFHHRACQLARRSGIQLAAHRQSALSQSLPLLGEGVRGLLRPRRRVGHRHELPVRHELVAVLRVHRQRARARHRLRGHHRVLPRGGLSRHHALRLGEASATGCISSPPAWWRWAR